ncbi:hypothetical protein HNR23_001855 [Nocardiopsis mwathae]|uniref:Uncharacterized protein n=1 Tax=Nocardiopsis mwathae TaxID=1472723 RepID=A0A7W9YH19_9ACTN|nr:hypothetical protein [Nocardiopsis mwathae]MBB6171795.1 hypothetical protein [Nocardiopsis mwathae]
MPPVENGGPPIRNTRHPVGVRVTAAILGLAGVVLGPVGYLKAVAADSGSAAEWFTLGFGAAVGLPLLAAAITTVAGDRVAARWSLALLLWPIAYLALAKLLLA